MDQLLARAQPAIDLYDRAMAIPAVREWVDVLRFVFSVSGAFWLVSKVLGQLAHWVHKALDRSLAELFAVVYNLALAVVFSSVLVYAIIAERGGKGNFLAYEAVGFVLVYIVLGAVYSEKSGRISEYALPGYWAALLSYLLFCVRTQYLRNPVTPWAYQGVAWVMHGWVEKAAAAITGAALTWRALSWIGRRIAGGMRSPTPQRRAS